MADVFISYSHKDRAFALQLVGALLQHKLTAWIDNKEVFPAGKFRDDIKIGIQEAGAFIFVLSPDALHSKECDKELKYAQEYGKKLIPIDYRSLGSEEAPLALQELDWIPASPSPELLGNDTAFEYMLEHVVMALKTDQHGRQRAAQWLRLATRWEEARTPPATEPWPFISFLPLTRGKSFQGARWVNTLHTLATHQRSHALLLRGQELREAEDWLKEAERKQREGQQKEPRPLPLYTRFIRESRRVANHLLLGSIIVLVLSVGLSVGGVFAFLYHDPTHVSTLQDNNGPGSLRYAVNEAPAKSTITFDTSLHGPILLTRGDLDIAKDLTIRGPGTGMLSISSGKSGFVVRVAQGVTVTISSFAFKNSHTSTSFIDNEGTLTLMNSIISGNTSTNHTSAQFTGGGISNHGTLTLSNCIISGNTSTYSVGGIFNEGTLTVTNSTISGNTAGAVSGGMLNTGTLTVSNSIIADNTSFGAGGGIYNYGTLTVSNSTIAGNKTSAGSTGGGIFNINQLTLNNSTVSGNISGEGGGITDQGGTLTLSNSTVSGNVADNDGGGIFFQSYTSTSGSSAVSSELLFSTIYGNIASTGRDIAIGDIVFNTNKPIKQISVVQIISSIVAGNPAYPGPDVVGMLRSYGYNLFQDNSGATFDPAARTQHGTDRILSVNGLTRLFADPVGLQNNGGTTKTYALGPGSLALDSVPFDYCLLTDQRGVKRPDGNERFCDIGAYEYQG